MLEQDTFFVGANVTPMRAICTVFAHHERQTVHATLENRTLHLT